MHTKSKFSFRPRASHTAEVIGVVYECISSSNRNKRSEGTAAKVTLAPLKINLNKSERKSTLLQINGYVFV